MNDLLLQRDVIAELNRALGADASQLGVEVHNGVVKLAGRMADQAIRQLAERVALQVPGTTVVINDIDLSRSTERLPV